MSLDRPIVVLGAARSGTTLLGDLVARVPGVAYWVEPKYIWRYGAAQRPDDTRGAADATPRVRRYIRDRFERFTRGQAASRFMEKTPSNCFRVPFIDAVLPDARIVHLLRDGRDVALSAYDKWTSPPDGSALVRRLRSFEIPLRDLPHYGVATVRDTVGRWAMPEQGFLWGPTFPGLQEIRERDGVLAACAWQWRRSVEAAQAGLAEVPHASVVTVRYQDLVADPRAELARILGELELPASPDLLDALAGEVRAGSVARWEREPERVADIEPILRPTLDALGFTRSVA